MKRLDSEEEIIKSVGIGVSFSSPACYDYGNRKKIEEVVGKRIQDRFSYLSKEDIEFYFSGRDCLVYLCNDFHKKEPKYSEIDFKDLFGVGCLEEFKVNEAWKLNVEYFKEPSWEKYFKLVGLGIIKKPITAFADYDRPCCGCS
jgi:hypothetical protein